MMIKIIMILIMIIITIINTNKNGALDVER